METQSKSNNSYIRENFGMITASKLKTFLKNPEEFFKLYIEEVNAEEEESEALLLGTAFDDLITYGEKTFYDMYFLDEGLKKAELQEKLDQNKIIYLEKDTIDILKTRLYGDISKKIRLTEGQSKTILAMYEEAKRQPLYDFKGEYQYQHEIKVNFGNLTLRTKMDRYKTGFIRDTKTCARLDKFVWDYKNEYQYDFSMAFYYMIVKIYSEESPVVGLDVFQKSNGGYAYFEAQSEELEQIISVHLIPALKQLNDMLDKWNETKDNTIWDVGLPHSMVYNSKIFKHLSSTIQKEKIII